jgi:muramoyltetrapeptide carboxypeptidase LdcA involved in peptidoglycan recycling
MDIIKPIALEQGDTIGIVAPSMYITDTIIFSIIIHIK